MSTVYGYARCSTNESRQDIGRQKRDLKALGVSADKYIYWEYESGSNTTRPELHKLLEIAQPGDTIVTTEVSRLSRSTKHLCEILEQVQQKKLRLVIGSFTADCRSEEFDPMTKGMLQMWAVFSEMEREMISQRVKSGMANAKAKGKSIGRPKSSKEKLPDKYWRYEKMYQAGEISVAEFARLMNCSRTTIYKYLSL